MEKLKLKVLSYWNLNFVTSILRQIGAALLKVLSYWNLNIDNKAS